MVVVYRLSAITYTIARLIVQVEYIAMANLLAAKEVVPELIQADATTERVVAAAMTILDDPARRATMRAELLDVRRSLGSPGAADRAAASLLALLSQHTLLASPGRA